MQPLKKTLACFALGLSFVCGFTSCATFVSTTPAGAPCTYTIQQPNTYDCYLNHAGTGRKIKLMINIKTKFVSPNNSGPNYIDFDDKTIVVDPSVTPFPISITASAPQDRYLLEVNIQGEECSTCANGLSEADGSSYGHCDYHLFPTNPATYLAAKPRWNGNTTFQQYHATENVQSAERILNVPQSCGCITN